MRCLAALLLFSLLCIVPTAAQETDALTKRDRSKYLSAERTSFAKALTSTVWVASNIPGLERFGFAFQEDGTFVFGTTLVFNKRDTGTYHVAGNRLTIRFDNPIDQYFRDYLHDGDNHFDFVRRPDSVWRRDVIVSRESSIEFFAVGSEPGSGQTAIIDGTEVTVVYGKYAVTEHVRTRTGPSTDYKTLFYGFEVPIKGDRIDYLLKGEWLFCYGRTKELVSIAGKADYWYFVYFGGENGHLAWVFGAYIEAYDETRSNDYAKAFQEDFSLIRRYP